MTENSLASLLLGKSGQHCTDMLAKEYASIIKTKQEILFINKYKTSEGLSINYDSDENDSNIDDFYGLAKQKALKRFFDDLASKNL